MKELTASIVLLLAACFIGVVIGKIVTMAALDSGCQKAAIERGHMMYDANTGKLKWVDEGSQVP